MRLGSVDSDETLTCCARMELLIAAERRYPAMLEGLEAISSSGWENIEDEVLR